MYLQQTLITLDVITGYSILWVWEVLPSKMLFLEEGNGQTWKDHVHNCVPHVILCMLMAKMTHLWWLFLFDYIICFVGNLRGLPLCRFVINVLEVGIWDILCHH